MHRRGIILDVTGMKKYEFREQFLHRKKIHSVEFLNVEDIHRLNSLISGSLLEDEYWEYLAIGYVLLRVGTRIVASGWVYDIISPGGSEYERILFNCSEVWEEDIEVDPNLSYVTWNPEKRCIVQ